MGRSPKGRNPKGRNPGISLTARAKVRRLHFDRVPETGTRFWGQQERKTESGTVRENLPEEVERGVVYRDARIRLKITAETTGAEKSPEDEREETPSA
ncbi:MAG: hypothetical protein WA990_00855 [Rubrobacteraceae bacterium]